MKIMIGRKYWQPVLVGSLLVTLVLGFIFNNQNKVVAESIMPSTETRVDVIKSERFAYPVSGTVQATEALTLYAKRSGFIEAVMVTEGETVEAGSLMIVAVDPVTEARLSVESVAGLLNELKAQTAEVSATEGQALAGIGYEQSVALTSLTDAADTARAQASLDQLKIMLLKVEMLVPQALRFVQDNPSLFTKQSLDEYRNVTRAFYGTVPDHFRIGPMTPSNDTALGSLMKTVTVATTSPELIPVGYQVASELEALLHLYQSSESEFFDDRLDSNTTPFTTYSDFREAIAEVSAGLIGSLDMATMRGDEQSIRTETNGRAVERASITHDSATAIQALTARMKDATTRLSGAEQAVLATELGLGITKAPFSGVVTDIHVEVGQYVEAGQPLLRLSGAGAREMKVRLEGAGLGAKVGDSYVINGTEVGVVDRIVSVLEAGSATAYVNILDTVPVGSVLQGELMVNLLDQQVILPRDVIRFAINGPYIVTKDGEVIALTIVHDSGDVVVVKPEREIEKDETFVPSFGVRL